MNNFKAPGRGPSKEQTKGDGARCMAALLRLITYARDEAKRLEADVLLFCLDAALAAAREESQASVSGTKHSGETAAVTHKRITPRPVH